MQKLLKRSDLWGTWLAVLCAIHCALMPLIISFLPALVGGVMEAEWLEFVLLGGGVGLGGMALFRGFSVHKNHLPLIGLGVASVLFSISLFVLGEGSASEIIVNLNGAGILAGAQLYNGRLIHRHTASCQH